MEVNIWNFSTLDQTNWHAIGGILVVTHIEICLIDFKDTGVNKLPTRYSFHFWKLMFSCKLLYSKEKKYYITLKFECLFK